MEVEGDDDEDENALNGELKADTKSFPGPIKAGPWRAGGPLLEASPISAADCEMPSLKYLRTRVLQSGCAGPGGSNLFRQSVAHAAAHSAYSGSDFMILTTQQVPDALDAFDKGLESVQAMCKHAAFQFLRKGDCNDKIIELKECLRKTADLAGKMIEQRLKEAYDVGNLPEPAKSRTYSTGGDAFILPDERLDVGR